MPRRTDGDETWNRLLNWTKGQKPSERLAAQILRSEGYKSIDPSHPLGGPDGVKDIVSTKDNLIWIGAAYFPRGQQSFSDISEKFSGDLKGIQKNNASALAFVTNQELTLGERKKLKEIGKPFTIEIFHLERIAGILDSPKNYGIRLEFLDVELTKEEQLSFFAEKDNQISELTQKIDYLMTDYNAFKASFEYGEDDIDLENRSVDEIIDYIELFTDKIWYDRHQLLKARVENKETEVEPEIWKGALAAAKKLEERIGLENLGPYSNFEWGMINGKLSALRWVLGEDWDMLDT